MTGFQQLYYTSCEHGLSRFSGFQFNAVSAGVTFETRQAVEALAGYEPPRYLMESDTPELLERCPVNLCHRPHDPQGRSATTLCVRYVGRDSARRFGNYFAHALHSEDFPAAGGGMLGIELWNSPVWTSTVSPSTDIPELTAPAPGPLDARAVSEFLRGHPHAARLPDLLSAVFAALGENGSVVVIERTTERIAHWFAAVSYLMPPPLARGLSFATYVLRPARSRLHLIGTVPEAQLAFGPDDEAAYTVFDFARGIFPEVPVGAAVRLLTRIGAGSIRPVWSWTADYARGGEKAPEEWHAPVAAAAASGGMPLTAADADAVIDWLAGADHLGARRAAVAADIHREHRDLDERRLIVLSAAAKAGGDDAVQQEIEGKLHGSRMRAYLDAGTGALEPVPITDPTARERATVLWRRLLTEVRTARERTRLLLWALGAGLPVPPEIMVRETRALARTLLGSAAPAPGFRHEVAELLRQLPAMRESLAAAVGEALRERVGQEQLFSQFPADLLREEDLAGRPLLLEHHLRARAEREPANTVPLMMKILGVRQRASPDEELLRGLWRAPSRTWTHREAARIARELPVSTPVDPAVGEWFDRALSQEVEGEEALEDCLDLCRQLAAPGRSGWLSPRARDRVRITLGLLRSLSDAREAGELVAAFAVPEAGTWAAPRALKRLRMVPALLGLPADTDRLRALLGNLTHRDLDLYLSGVACRVGSDERIDDVLLGHVAAVVTLPDTVPVSQAQGEMVVAIRSHPYRHWSAADLSRLEAVVRPHGADLADRYAERAESRRQRAPRDAPRRFPLFGRRAATAAATQDDPPRRAAAAAQEPPPSAETRGDRTGRDRTRRPPEEEGPVTHRD
ncbi:GTPase-associated protein 1-related protein [Streptomyces sp. AM 2-1-1]|uniref:GTPase-associated protein 1-related protein n=1 Tax=Streptomyces sp. AM 2-1-1 TaxID=3028709 RepID=UPI0023B99FF2|nr:GTPase-associated protein 1-related protein [Streptomyces sp. AM 2-1-1]WEH42984.1 GTPase-associated protein 1-related protein [Streptomyces sp. AM 2-1-1]